MTDSRSSVGWKMVPSICARWSSFQLSFLKINAPLLPRSSRTGSRSRSLSPACAREGPMPRRNSFLGVLPVMIKPPIMTLSPVPTRRRVEMFKAWAGDAVAVGVAVGVAGGGGGGGVGGRAGWGCGGVWGGGWGGGGPRRSLWGWRWRWLWRWLGGWVLWGGYPPPLDRSRRPTDRDPKVFRDGSDRFDRLRGNRHPCGRKQ